MNKDDLQKRYLFAGNRVKPDIDTEVGTALSRVDSFLKRGLKEDALERIKPWYILLPSSTERLVWDVICTMTVLFAALNLPYLLSFRTQNEESLSSQYIAYDTIIGVIFALDIVVNFMTAIRDDQGDFDYCLHRIAMKYLGGMFMSDLLAIIPLSPFRGTVVQFGVLILKLLKLPVMVRIQRHMCQRDFSVNFMGILRLLFSLVVIFIVNHVGASIWHYLGTRKEQICDGLNLKEAKEEFCPWTFRHGISETSSEKRYIASIYWTLSTLATVGYGDIRSLTLTILFALREENHTFCSAYTVPEYFFSMLAMVLGVSWYAYVVGSMSRALSEIDLKKRHLHERGQEINLFIRNSKLSPALAKKIRKQYEYHLHTSRWASVDSKAVNQILNELPEDLRVRSVLYIEQSVIRNINFFRGRPLKFIAEMVRCLKPIEASSGHKLLSRGKPADRCLFLLKGYVQSKLQGLVCATYQNGATIGDEAFIHRGIYEFSAIALGHCDLCELSGMKLQEVMGTNPDVYREFSLQARIKMVLAKWKIFVNRRRRSRKGLNAGETQLHVDTGWMIDDEEHEDLSLQSAVPVCAETVTAIAEKLEKLEKLLLGITL